MTTTRAKTLARALQNRTRHVSIVVDGVHGAHNMGAIARSCDAWGIQDLHFVRPRDDETETGEENQGVGDVASLASRFDTETSVAAVSKNAQKWLTLHEHHTPSDCIQALRARGYAIAVSSVAPTARSIEELDVSKPIALVFGSEQSGVSTALIAAADAIFTIPMVGFVESMNVSVAVATAACVTIPRARLTAPVAYPLPPEEARALARQWLHRPRRPRSTPRPLITRNNAATRLGYAVEARCISNGLFSPVNDGRTVLRLSGDTGSLLADYVARRKFGALAERSWERRCETCSAALVAPHALAVETATKGVYKRRQVLPVLRAAVGEVHKVFEPVFDDAGVPRIPPGVHGAHSHVEQALAAVPQALANTIARAMNPADACFIKAQVGIREAVSGASLGDVAFCVANAARLPDPLAVQQSVLAVVAEHSNNVGEAVSPASTSPQNNASSVLDTDLKVVLQQLHSHTTSALPIKALPLLYLMMCIGNAALLTAALHDAAWRRAAAGGGGGAPHAVRHPRFALLEGVAVHAYGEALASGSSVESALLRSTVEWGRILVLLRDALAFSPSVC